jgi:hypothetical protein
MARVRPRLGTFVRAAVGRTGYALALLGVTLWAAPANGYPSYDDGAGNGCVQCHTQFQNGNGTLHNNHRNGFGITQCNLCHPAGGGSTPVLTYWSGTGGGFGCAGCHGQDYGETSPNSGQPKATAYGLRAYHVNQGVMTCGVAGGCHTPGNLGHPNPFPPLFAESVAPPYYAPAYSNLTDPCSSAEEDLPFDMDLLGLDNDGNGLRDYPADPGCSSSTTSSTTTTSTTTTTTTLPVACSPAPTGGCVAAGKGLLFVNEKSAGKEKLKVKLTKLQPVVTPGQFGDPVTGTTNYAICVYDAADALAGEYSVSRAGDTCAGKPCWSLKSGKGYKYTDKSTTADGIKKMTLFGGDAGKGKIVILGKNNPSAPSMPTDVAAALLNQTGATVQLLTNDASCFGMSLPQVKKADGKIFKALGP